MIKRIKHGKIRITCRITLDPYHPSGIKALGLILMSRDDTTYDTDFAMYYSLYISFLIVYILTLIDDHRKFITKLYAPVI